MVNARIAIIPALILAGCSFEPDLTPLTPFQCRVTGVNVQDEDTVTGTVLNVTRHYNGVELRAACEKPFSKDVKGCSVPVNVGEYEVHYMKEYHGPDPRGIMEVRPSYNTVLNHELCHAYYEEAAHVE
jgi:hypothetical protein